MFAPEYTAHARVRAQHRSIPPLISILLDQYGTEELVDGAVIQRFSKSSIRKLEKVLGWQVVQRLSCYHNVYQVRAADTDKIVTIARKTKRRKRQ